MLKGRYFNLQLNNGFIYARESKDELHKPEFLYRINLESGKIEKFPQSTMHAYVNADGNILYYTKDGYYFSDWKMTFNELVFANERSDQYVFMIASKDKAVFYDRNNNKIYLYDYKSKPYLLFNINGNIADCMLRDDIVFVHFYTDKKEHYIKTYHITDAFTEVKPIEQRFEKELQSSWIYIMNKTEVDCLAKKDIRYFNTLCVFHDYYVISISHQKPYIYLFNDSVIVESDIYVPT